MKHCKFLNKNICKQENHAKMRKASLHTASTPTGFDKLIGFLGGLIRSDEGLVGFLYCLVFETSVR